MNSGTYVFWEFNEKGRLFPVLFSLPHCSDSDLQNDGSMCVMRLGHENHRKINAR